MARPMLSAFGLVALLAGCGTKWSGLDVDGDGYSAADGDCWEGTEGPIPGVSGADIYPGAPDAWYDGVDADCAGNDDYDADGDGYVPEAFLGLDTLGIVESTGALHKGVDCWDAPDDVVLDDGSVDSDYIAAWRDDPANSDWIDANGDDDLMPFVVVAGNYGPDGGAFSQPRPSEVNPEATGDLLYDDVDLDCDGAPEFDQDGDGEDALLQPRRSGAVGGDCVDGSPLEDFDADNLAGLGPADIYSTATDTWYDGVDQDCGGNDDCDADGDGYLRAPSASSPDNPLDGVVDDAVMLEVCGIDETYDQDCKDSDAAVAPDPSIEEIFYNYTDDNCIIRAGDLDGDADGDGHWAADYDFEAVDDTLEEAIDGVAFDDCWDNPDDRPAAFVSATVFGFDPAQPDLTDPSTLGVAYDLDEDGNTDEVDAAATHPGAFDRPYDGVDQDCAGDLSADFDWDGDGYDSLYQYEDVDGSWSVRGDDCMDCSDDCATAEPGSELEAVCAEVCDNDAHVLMDGATAGLTNAGELYSTSVNPGRTETWYDGTDADCSRTSDYDQDGDFYGDRSYEGDPDTTTDDPWVVIDEGRPGYYAGGLNGGGDCNDIDADYNPGPDGVARESWYDGLDHDCADNDDYDADYDGERSDEHTNGATIQGQNAAGADIVAVAASANTNTDCVDSFGEVANADDYRGDDAIGADSWYDGEDWDCQGDDDYDADGDTYRDDQYASAATVQGLVTVVAAGARPHTDCVDDPLEASNAASYNPGATEVWYDGEDWDCAGDDDFDADADGFRTEDSTATATIQGADTVVALGSVPETDCVDDPDEASDAASYYPGASDSWYDGRDHDCAGDDDYDADADGERTDDYALRATIQGDTTVVAASAGTRTDCVDDPTEVANAEDYNTAATDLWYDGEDFDCAGDDDYDADADGYRSDAYAAAATVQGTDTVVASGANPNTDCVDDLLEASNAASYNPGATEVWYDAEDFDCAGDDDYDADADGYRSDAYAAAATYQGPDVVVASGANPNTDCVDTGVTDASSYYPGASDAWYDGKDYDCAGDDDYDQDGDGFRSDAYAAAATVQGTTTVVTAAANPNDDCVDTSAAYNTGATDTWYDGLDHDCAGDDDYDQDGDGYRSDAHSAAPTTQDGAVVVAAGANPNTDCVDTSTAYNPGVSDTWYDGLDTDCAENDDYDQDGDGERTDASTVSTGATTQDGTVVVAAAAATATDCVDTDAAYNTAATEVWYDGEDWDCAEDDDFDADGDGERSDDYTAAATYQDTTVVVPSTAAANTDCVDDLAVDADAADYNAAATDTWYDGRDHDCVGNDDYDQDGDGDRSDAHTAAATVQGSVTVVASGAATNTDCVDTSSAYNASATDVWYDGLDHDCGDNDDYDQDGDGQRSDAYAAAATFQGVTEIIGSADAANTDCVDTDTAYALGATDTWYDGFDHDCGDNDDYDRDGDGDRSDAYAAAATVQGATTVVSAGANPNTDCLDTNAAFYAAATDTWYDGLDHDCAGNDDYDQDADGYRSDSYAAAPTFQGGVAVVGLGANPNTDCVDTSTAYNPGATDSWYDGLDHDCAGNDDYDADADGQRSDAYAALATTQDGTTVVGSGANPNTDCLDSDDSYYDGAADSWYDGLDKDCAGDDDYDADADGQRSDDYGAAATRQGTTVVVGLLANPNTDCVDSDATYKVGATDVWYDGYDKDCGGEDDYDQDGDGDRSSGYAALPTYQDTTEVVAAIDNPNDDCIDTDAAYSSLVTDLWYDGLDHDCGSDDDYDADADGERSDAYAAAATLQGASTVVASGANPNTDCVDSDANYNAAATEVWYDGADWDCLEDDDFDADADGFRSDAYAAAATVQGATTVVASGANPNTDCVDDPDDAADAASYFPGASDTWYDGKDHDCVGDDDYDQDGDGDRSDAYAAAATVQGPDTVVALAANSNDDCDDTDGAINVSATEIWYDGVDQDCDSGSDYDADGDGDDAIAHGGVDCDDADAGVSTFTWYADTDTDGYGDPLSTNGDCTMPTGYVADSTDCDDTDGAVNPGASETLDGIDEDCNGYHDDDGVITAASEYVKITEFIPDPSGLDTAEEWVELYNPNAFDIVLDAGLWNLGESGVSPYTIVGPVSIAAGEHVVFGRNTDTALNGDVVVLESYGSKISIAHTASSSPSDIYVEYDDPTALVTVEVDLVEYDFSTTGAWNALVVNGKSVELDYDTGSGTYAADNNDVANWCVGSTRWGPGLDYGTPNAVNDGCP